MKELLLYLVQFITCIAILGMEILPHQLLRHYKISDNTKKAKHRNCDIFALYKRIVLHSLTQDSHTLSKMDNNLRQLITNQPYHFVYSWKPTSVCLWWSTKNADACRWLVHIVHFSPVVPHFHWPPLNQCLPIRSSIVARHGAQSAGVVSTRIPAEAHQTDWWIIHHNS